MRSFLSKTVYSTIGRPYARRGPPFFASLLGPDVERWHAGLPRSWEGSVGGANGDEISEERE